MGFVELEKILNLSEEEVASLEQRDIYMDKEYFYNWKQNNEAILTTNFITHNETLFENELALRSLMNKRPKWKCVAREPE